MEPHADEHGGGGTNAVGLGAGSACAAWPHTTQIVGSAEFVAYARVLCSCGFRTHDEEEVERKTKHDNEEEGFQNEIESWPISYLRKKSACLRWRLDASCC